MVDIDDVALFVEFDVIVSLGFTVSLRRDHDLCASFCDGFAKMVGVITLVGDCRVRLEAVDEIMRKGDVVTLPGTGDEADGIAQSVPRGMDFGAQPASRPAQALGIRPPFT